jgi:6,7-dimethyl-8-ribityllumazine synthase
MAELTGRLTEVGRIGIVVSRYHEGFTTRLLEGARRCCREAGIADDAVDVVWVSGAFELGSVAAAMAASGRYAGLVALGVVIRGETPHFDYVAGETARAIGTLAVAHELPIGFGVLTVDTPEQALARAGGPLGDKGYEAAEAAIRSADVIRMLRSESSST